MPAAVSLTDRLSNTRPQLAPAVARQREQFNAEHQPRADPPSPQHHPAAERALLALRGQEVARGDAAHDAVDVPRDRIRARRRPARRDSGGKSLPSAEGPAPSEDARTCVSRREHEPSLGAKLTVEQSAGAQQGEAEHEG